MSKSGLVFGTSVFHGSAVTGFDAKSMRKASAFGWSVLFTGVFGFSKGTVLYDIVISPAVSKRMHIALVSDLEPKVDDLGCSSGMASNTRFLKGCVAFTSFLLRDQEDVG